MSAEIGAIGSGSTSASVKTARAAGTSDFSSVLQKSSGSVDLDAIFKAAAEKYNVPVRLLKAVAKTESNYNPKATSSCGAMGIMQLMPSTAKSLGVTDAYDPEQNIMGGAKYLSQLLNRFGGNTSLAVAAYNAGPGAVAKYNGIPPYDETQNYVKKVLGYLGSDLNAGTVATSSADTSVTGGAVTETSAYSLLAAMISSGQLSGADGTSLTSMIGSLSTSDGDASETSSKLMTSIYQMQLEMLKGGSGDDGGDSSVIV
ncbi:lytic transglycosylase domain-containing protein [Oscillospiraceae bacterium WX1]